MIRLVHWPKEYIAMSLTHQEMVQEALSNEQAGCKYDDEMTVQDIQVYILVNFNEQVTISEISEAVDTVKTENQKGKNPCISPASSKI